MTTKTLVATGVLVGLALVLSFFGYSVGVNKRAASLEALSEKQQQSIIQSDSQKTSSTTKASSAASPNVILTGGTGMTTGIMSTAIASSPAGSGSITWSTVNNSAPWGRRTEHASVVFKNEVWVLGGSSNISGVQLNGTWSSPDGITWTQRSLATPWEKANGNAVRIEHAAAVFDNKIWVIGGYSMKAGSLSTRMADIWSSPDGINWTQVTANAPFGIRNNLGLTVLNGKMYLTGNVRIGTTAQAGDVWSSPDGITWTQITPTLPAGIGLRQDFGFLSFDNKLWIIGGTIQVGSNGTATNDVWSSPDGITWTRVLTAAPWGKRYKFSSFVFDKRMWIVGGQLPTGGMFQYTDMWSTKDGITWSLEQTTVPNLGYIDSAVAVFDAPTAPQVDLVVSDIEWSMDNIHYAHGTLATSLSGQAWFRATLKNKGPDTYVTSPTTVFRLHDKQILPTSTIGQAPFPAGVSIPPGGTIQLTFPEIVPTGLQTYVVGGKKSAGTVSVIGFVDAIQLLAETDETNNTYPVNIPVSGY